MKKLLAKMYCANVDETGAETNNAFLNVVASGSAENEAFSKATPSGNLSLNIDKEKDAATFFQPGKQYLVEITEVVEATEAAPASEDKAGSGANVAPAAQ